MYELECAGYEAAAAALDAYAGAMLDGWPADEHIETGFSFGGLFSSITHAVSNVATAVVKNNPVARVVQKAIAPITRTVTSAAQTLVNGVRKYNPVALAKMAAIKAKALAGDIKNSVIFKTLSAVASKALAPALTVIRSVAGPVLPYVQSVMSFLFLELAPGISAALGAAQALADGRPIDEAIIAGAKSAIPGADGSDGVRCGLGVSHGRPVDTAVLGALRERMPGALAQRAFDTGLALAAAKSAQDRRSALHRGSRALASNLPPAVSSTISSLPAFA